jgi:hypothetical protein
MPGLTDQAVGNDKPKQGAPERAQKTWEESMLNMLDRLRADLREKDPYLIATHCEATFKESIFSLSYWGENLSIRWPELEVMNAQGDPSSTFDSAMIIYYLQTADGTSMADRWIGFRELPNGAFYNQAFQGYTGNRLARTFGESPDKFDEAAEALGGWKLPALAQHAYAFQPLPRIRLAATLWPGDEEFPSKASVLFDAAASHYMVTDGLALLGSGLTGRLIRQLNGS